jgi:hypothetical protein
VIRLALQGAPLRPLQPLVRPVRSSPSPAPYDTGFETLRVQQMLSASQAASTSARRQGTMSPSPAPSYALMPIAPMSEGGGSSPFMSLGSPTPSASGEGWCRPEQYAGALRTDAAWLNKFRSGRFGELSEADKLHVADSVGSLIQAAHDAGVLYWPSKAMETVMEQILTSTGEEEENHSTYYNQDVDMRPPPPSMAWPGPSASSRGRALCPIPLWGGEGACLRERGGTWAPPLPLIAPPVLCQRGRTLRLPALMGGSLIPLWMASSGWRRLSQSSPPSGSR